MLPASLTTTARTKYNMCYKHIRPNKAKAARHVCTHPCIDPLVTPIMRVSNPVALGNSQVAVLNPVSLLSKGSTYTFNNVGVWATVVVIGVY